MSAATIGIAAALGGHLLHVIVIGGALLLAAVVYAVATITAPPLPEQPVARERPVAARIPRPASAHRGRERDRGAAVAQQLAFLGLCAAAGTHLAVIPDHFKESWTYGAFFVVVAPLQIGLAWLVLVRARRAELTAALSFSLSVLVLWAVSRFVGVPIGPDNGATEKLGVLDLFASVCESLTVSALLFLRCSGHFGRSRGRSIGSAWRWSQWSRAMRSIFAATAVAVPLLSLFASRS